MKHDSVAESVTGIMVNFFSEGGEREWMKRGAPLSINETNDP